MHTNYVRPIVEEMTYSPGINSISHIQRLNSLRDVCFLIITLKFIN